MANLLPGDSSHHGIYKGEPSEFSQDMPKDGGRWYFSRKELEEDSPSRRDGIDLKRETYLRKSYCTFLQDLGMKLKVPQITIATAIIFCHRFYLRQSHTKNDRRTVATVCMFLAGKVEETPRPLKDVIIVSYEIIHKKDKDPDSIYRIKQKEVYEQQKELILLGERVVLATLAFDLNVLHPYKPLVEAIKKFKVAQNALAQVAWNFVNDGLRTSLCLQFKPHHVAAGAIFLAAKFLKVKLPSDGDRMWWQEFDVTPRQLEVSSDVEPFCLAEVSNQMLELYEQNRVQPSHGDVEGSTGSGGTHRASSKALSITEEYPAATSSYSQASATTSRPGPLKPVSVKAVSEQPLADTHCAPPRTTQSQHNDYRSVEMENALDDDAYADSNKDDLYSESETLPYQNKGKLQRVSRFGADALGEEDQGRIVARREAREVGESKDKRFVRNLEHSGGTVGQSPQDTIKKLDTDKLKAAVEKRRQSRVGRTQKTDLMDEDDLIEREVENGIEREYENSNHQRHLEDAGDVPRERRRQSSHVSDLENVEEGEVSVPDDLGRGSDPPKPSNRKRKVGSPPERGPEGRPRQSYGLGSHHHNYDYIDDRNKMSRVGWDHRRHIPENHV
ncbi:Cyclin-T1-5 [Citrus sinensis]|nr:Cyclin-T1-5 [Citrus sinensis]